MHGQRRICFLHYDRVGATYTDFMPSPHPPLYAVRGYVLTGAMLTVTLSAMSAIAAPEANSALLESGRKLVAEAKCEACHASKLGGDGTGMYLRADRRVTTKSKLLPQVSRCNTELNLGLFPEDEAAIAAYLNALHYKFKD